MNKNEIEITQAGVCRGVSEPGESVAERVVGKIYRPFWEDRLSPAIGGWFCRDTGSGKLICRVNSEFSSGKISYPSPQSSGSRDVPMEGLPHQNLVKKSKRHFV